MPQKQKGSNAEREVVRLFWDNGWAAVRVAGSGAARFPCPDIVASNKIRQLAVECKATKSKKKYIEKAEIEQLRAFSRRFGAEPWVGIRFARQNWLFINPDDLNETDANYVISEDHAKTRGLSLRELIGQ